MLNQPTIEKLQTMKLHGMADAFHAQLETANASQLSFEERFAMLVDQQWGCADLGKTTLQDRTSLRMRLCGVSRLVAKVAPQTMMS